MRPFNPCTGSAIKTDTFSAFFNKHINQIKSRRKLKPHSTYPSTQIIINLPLNSLECEIIFSFLAGQDEKRAARFVRALLFSSPADVPRM
jgi:hypothetical protein